MGSSGVGHARVGEAAHLGAESGAIVRHLGADDRSSPRIRIVDAALLLIVRQGTRKTTVDDLAKEAGISRATFYRTFPDGKDEVFRAVVDTEVSRLFSEIAVAMGGAGDLEEVLTAGIVVSARWLADHEALGVMLEREPEVILPHLAFAEMDRVLEVTSALVAPFFGRWLGPGESLRAAEWAVRVVISYLAVPNDSMDLADPTRARRLVGRILIPGIQALRAAEAPTLSPTYDSLTPINKLKAG